MGLLKKRARSIFGKEKRKISARRIKGFWAEFSHNRIGLVGLVIIIAYVVVAFGAPLLTQYSPTREWSLASGWAKPDWITIFPEYSDLPRTMEHSLDWVVGQGSELVNVTVGDGWVTEYSGNQSTTIKIQSSFAYNYQAPDDLTFKFMWETEAAEATEYLTELYIISPFGAEYIIWSTYQHQSVTQSFTSTNTSATPVNIASVALAPRTLERLGILDYQKVTHRIFVEKGDYKLMFKISFKPASEGTARISITEAEFKIFGLVHGLLGTDNLGSDLWSQLIWGTQISLAVGLMAAFLSTTMGISVGIVSGYSGGFVDETIMRIVDILLALPVLPLLLAFFMLWGANVFYLVILIAVFGWQGLSRLVRSQVLYLKEMPFVECAKASGAGRFYIMFRHLLPNVLPVALAALVLSVPAAILTEAALSFIGFGDPTVPTWGRMLNQAFNFGAFRYLSWNWILPPGIALTALTLAFVFVGHAVDEVVNPRLRRRR